MFPIVVASTVDARPRSHWLPAAGRVQHALALEDECDLFVFVVVRLCAARRN
jgi:hypothetical protein